RRYRLDARAPLRPRCRAARAAPAGPARRDHGGAPRPRAPGARGGLLACGRAPRAARARHHRRLPLPGPASRVGRARRGRLLRLVPAGLRRRPRRLLPLDRAGPACVARLAEQRPDGMARVDVREDPEILTTRAGYYGTFGGKPLANLRFTWRHEPGARDAAEDA